MTECRQYILRQNAPRQARGWAPPAITRLPSALAAAVSMVFLSAPVAAGTIGGAMGNISRATIGISVSVAPRIELLRAGPQSTSKAVGGNGMQAAQPLCIWGNTPLGTYNVTALGEGFPVRDANGLAYGIQWESPAGGPAPIDLSSGSTVNELTAARSVGCGGAATAGLVVRLPDASERDSEGEYAGTLLLLVAPD